jgi:hypothetical protein
MYTPAVTMVAAWMSADTGVGLPSRRAASVSGSWADFAAGAHEEESAMAV